MTDEEIIWLSILICVNNSSILNNKCDINFQCDAYRNMSNIESQALGTRVIMQGYCQRNFQFQNYRLKKQTNIVSMKINIFLTYLQMLIRFE